MAEWGESGDVVGVRVVATVGEVVESESRSDKSARRDLLYLKRSVAWDPAVALARGV